jgi:hypothetical protein
VTSPSEEAVAPRGPELAVLGWLAPYAIGLAVASVFGRALVPAAIGTVPWSDQLLYADGFVAQALGALSTVLLALLLVRASTSRRAVPARVVVTVFGGLSLLIAMTSSGGTRSADPLLFAGSLAAGFVCLVVAGTGARKLPELALGLAWLAGSARLVAVYLTARGSRMSEVVATLGFAVELGIVAVAVVFLLRARGRALVAIAVALALAAVAAWLIVAEPEAPRWLLVRHAFEGLAPRPRPLGPAILAPVLATFALALSVGLVIARRADRAVVGSLAIVLAVRAHAEVPLLGVALTIAAVALFLARAPVRGAEVARDAAGRGNSPRAAAQTPAE